MPDYGQELRFGSFLTPTNANAHDVVAAAVAGERAGLDLVTFQDHPYQPRFLDTWTLISYVAARTSTVRLAGNVLNLPLRPPAVLARSVASLDLLSGGRIELGLGAGAFWDAIEAMGGPRRSPGAAVDALSEAIDVVRGVWDVDSTGVLRLPGEHYQVAGAKRGPAPAHPVEIWLGAYQPRMLRLTARKADGWLPSIDRMSMPESARANKVIDEAAAEAGRDPREIRRLANVPGRFGPASEKLLSGPVEQWVEQLTVLALEYGFSTFVLAGDDVSAYERIGQEVAPAVREAVAAARGT